MDILTQISQHSKTRHSEFLGIHILPSEARQQKAFPYEQELVSKYPMSDDCEGQQTLIASLQQEFEDTKGQIAVTGDKKRLFDLTRKLRAINAYLNVASNYQAATTCAKNNLLTAIATDGWVNPPQAQGVTTDPVLASMPVGSVAATAPMPPVPQNQIISGIDNKTFGYIAAAVVGLLVLKSL